MKFYSELTKKLYDSNEACEKAEADYKQQLDEAEAKKKELAETKAARAKEVTDAYKKAREAQKEYEKLRNSFVQTYGAYHLSFTDPEERVSFFENFFTF